MTEEVLPIYGHQMGAEALWDWFDAYVHAPEDADIAIRGGSPEGRPEVRLLVLTVDHPGIDETTALLDVEQARSFLGTLEDVSAKHPDAADALGLGRLQAGLGDALRQLEVGRVH
jgi:hypothetical protein